MESILIIAVVVVWYSIGLGSFIYWWTKDDDLTIGVLSFGLIVGLIGLIAFIGGWFIHGDNIIKDRTIIKKRTKCE